jgi:hypothetical protein
MIVEFHLAPLWCFMLSSLFVVVDVSCCSLVGFVPIVLTPWVPSVSQGGLRRHTDLGAPRVPLASPLVKQELGVNAVVKNPCVSPVFPMATILKNLCPTQAVSFHSVNEIVKNPCLTLSPVSPAATIVKIRV